jgi:secreted trypsin-like serine protease
MKLRVSRHDAVYHRPGMRRTWVLVLIAGCTSQNTLFKPQAVPDGAADVAVADGTEDAGDAEDAGVDLAPAGPEAAVDVSAPARLVLEPAEGRFDGMSGCFGTSVTFRITNAGEDRSGVLVAEVDDVAFKIGADTCTGQELPPAGSCDVTVTFQPGGQGQRSAKLGVTAHPGGHIEASLRGYAWGNDTTSVTPNAVSYLDTQVGQTSDRQAFELRNTGGMPFTLRTAMVSTSEFLITADRCSGGSLASGASCDVEVAFRPQSAGQKSAILTFQAGACGGTGLAMLSGRGYAPGVALAIVEGGKDFGRVNFPCGSAPALFHVRNDGSTSSAVKVTVTGPFELVKNSCDGRSLAHDESCEVSVAFAPTAMGAHQGTLEVKSADGAASVALQGLSEGQGDPTFSPGDPDFGTIAIGQKSAPVELSLLNPGPNPSAFGTFVQGIAANDFAITKNDCGVLVAPGSSCRLEIVFTPSQAGGRTATLLASGQECASGATIAQLRGTGL